MVPGSDRAAHEREALREAMLGVDAGRCSRLSGKEVAPACHGSEDDVRCSIYVEGEWDMMPAVPCQSSGVVGAAEELSRAAVGREDKEDKEEEDPASSCSRYHSSPCRRKRQRSCRADGSAAPRKRWRWRWRCAGPSDAPAAQEEQEESAQVKPVNGEERCRTSWASERTGFHYVDDDPEESCADGNRSKWKPEAGQHKKPLRRVWTVPFRQPAKGAHCPTLEHLWVNLPYLLRGFLDRYLGAPAYRLTTDNNKRRRRTLSVFHHRSPICLSSPHHGSGGSTSNTYTTATFTRITRRLVLLQAYEVLSRYWGLAAAAASSSRCGDQAIALSDHFETAAVFHPVTVRLLKRFAGFRSPHSNNSHRHVYHRRDDVAAVYSSTLVEEHSRRQRTEFPLYTSDAGPPSEDNEDEDDDDDDELLMGRAGVGPVRTTLARAPPPPPPTATSITPLSPPPLLLGVALEESIRSDSSSSSNSDPTEAHEGLLEEDMTPPLLLTTNMSTTHRDHQHRIHGPGLQQQRRPPYGRQLRRIPLVLRLGLLRAAIAAVWDLELSDAQEQQREYRLRREAERRQTRWASGAGLASSYSSDPCAQACATAGSQRCCGYPSPPRTDAADTAAHSLISRPAAGGATALCELLAVQNTPLRCPRQAAGLVATLHHYLLHQNTAPLTTETKKNGTARSGSYPRPAQRLSVLLLSGHSLLAEPRTSPQREEAEAYRSQLAEACRSLRRAATQGPFGHLLPCGDEKEPHSLHMNMNGLRHVSGAALYVRRLATTADPQEGRAEAEAKNTPTELNGDDKEEEADGGSALLFPCLPPPAIAVAQLTASLPPSTAAHAAASSASSARTEDTDWPALLPCGTRQVPGLCSLQVHLLWSPLPHTMAAATRPARHPPPLLVVHLAWEEEAEEGMSTGRRRSAAERLAVSQLLRGSQGEKEEEEEEEEEGGGGGGGADEDVETRHTTTRDGRSHSNLRTMLRPTQRWVRRFLRAPTPIVWIETPSSTAATTSSHDQGTETETETKRAAAPPWVYTRGPVEVEVLAAPPPGPASSRTEGMTAVGADRREDDNGGTAVKLDDMLWSAAVRWSS